MKEVKTFRMDKKTKKVLRLVEDYFDIQNSQAIRKGICNYWIPKLKEQREDE